MSGWGIFAGFAAFVVLSIAVPLLRTDLQAGILVLAERLIVKAAGYLPAEERAFREPEWLGELDWMAVKGFRLGLLAWAVQHLASSWFRRETIKQAKGSTEENNTNRTAAVDEARRRGELLFDEKLKTPGLQSASLLDLQKALEHLEDVDERSSNVLRLHLFSGLQFSEIAQLMKISRATVMRDYKYARLWLRRNLDD